MLSVLKASTTRRLVRLLPSGATPTSCLGSRYLPVALRTIEARSYWCDVIRTRVDKTSGKSKHEDPERVVIRHQEQRRSDGEALLDMHYYNDRHEKAWMRRKRMAEKRRYEFDRKHVTDLAKYIAFVQDNKQK
jgi:hypothetical protein